MVSAEIAVAMAVSIENPADCEVRGVIRFLPVDKILGYLAEEQALAWNFSVARQFTSAYCPADTSLAAIYALFLCCNCISIYFCTNNNYDVML